MLPVISFTLTSAFRFARDAGRVQSADLIEFDILPVVGKYVTGYVHYPFYSHI